MKQFLKFAKVFLAVMLFGVAFAACGNGGGTSGESVVNLAESIQPTILHSVTSNEAVNNRIINNFQEGLYRRNLENVLEPAVATSYEVDATGTVYTFKLRKEAKWANGEPVTAHDFVFSWFVNATNPKAGYKNYTDLVVNGKALTKGEVDKSQFGVVALSDYELQVTLESPVAYFLDLVATTPLYPLNEKFYNEVGGDEVYGTSKDTVLGNGAYVLSEYDPATGYTLTKNPEYWDAKNVQVETVNVRVVKEVETQAVMWDQGDLDRLELKGDLGVRYADDAKKQVQKESRTGYIYLSGTTSTPSPLLANKNFRMAVAHAFDKQVLADTTLKDGSVPSDYLIPKNFVKNEKGQDFREYANQYNDPYFDVAKAKEYLEKAKAELAGVPLEFTLNTPDEQPVKLMMESLVAQINQNLPEVKVTLQSHPRSVYYSMLFEHGTPAGFSTWGAPVADPFTFFNLFTEGTTFNFPVYDNAEFNRLFKQAASAEDMNDQTKRWDTLVATEKTLLDDFVVIPVYQKGTTILASDRVENLTGKADQAVNEYRHLRLK